MSSTLELALAVVLFAVPRGETPPDSHEVDQLVERYFDSPRESQLTIEERLDLLPPLTEKEIAAWKDKLFKRARKGRKAELGATNYFYDEKKKTGKYLADDARSPALVVCMHGGGEGAGDAESAKGGFGATLSKLDVLAVYPEVLRKTEHGWGEEDTERFVLELIEAVKRTRKIDPDRIYLTGHSMGGYGTYTIGARNADTFAGLAAFAGAPTPYYDRRKPGSKAVYDVEDGILPNLRNVPLFFYQSRDDLNVPPEVNVYLAATLPQLQATYGGYEHLSEIVDGRGHAFPEKGPLPGVKWALSHVRDPRPKRLLWQPVRKWKRMFYWLWWEEPEIGAELDVEVKFGNAILIRTEATDVKRLAVFVDERLLDVTKPVRVSVNGDVRFDDIPVARLSTLLRTIASRNDPELAFARRIDL